MAKKTAEKSAEMLGLGIMAILGFVLGLGLFLLLYGWYLSGWSDSTNVLVTAILLIVIMYVIFIVAVMIGKKYGKSYERAVWLGIGFTIALIIAGIILGYLGLSTSVTVSGLVHYKINRNRIPFLT